MLFSHYVLFTLLDSYRLMCTRTPLYCRSLKNGNKEECVVATTVLCLPTIAVNYRNLKPLFNRIPREEVQSRRRRDANYLGDGLEA
jgi:hypothetical protein